MIFKDCYEKYIKVYPDGKYYHSGVWHINNMLIDLASYWNDYVSEFKLSSRESVRQFEVAQIAVLFHDIVYKVGAKNNEEKSAEFVRKAIPDYKYLDEVCDLILSTKVSNKVFDTPLKKFIHDLDFKGFMFYDDICVNEEKLKAEAVRDGFSEKEFLTGQMKFYRQMAKKDLYLTSMFYTFNMKAKRNILKRIKELTAD